LFAGGGFSVSLYRRGKGAGSEKRREAKAYQRERPDLLRGKKNGQTAIYKVMGGDRSEVWGGKAAHLKETLTKRKTGQKEKVEGRY